MKIGRRTWTNPARLLAFSVVPWLVCLGGCLGHNNIERIDGAVGFDNPNEQPVPAAMSAALRWVIDRYPPNPDQPIGRFPTEEIAVNLPARMRLEMADKVLRDVAPNLRVLTPENATTLPVYHVGRVLTRADAASVDVFRPVSAMGTGPGGKPVYQAITVNLRAGFAPYRVVSHRVWPVGTLDLPTLNFPQARPAAGMDVPPAAAPEAPASGEQFPQ